MITSARLLNGRPIRGYRTRAAFLTLTYLDRDGWSARHVSECVDRIAKWLRRRGHRLAYVWVAELQERGAIHFHLVLWLPRHLRIPKPDEQGWWPHGSSQIEWARKPVGYLAGYVAKFDAPELLPKGIRLHGRGGLDDPERREVRWWLAPRYVQEAFGTDADPVRVRGGGWCDRTSGEWIPAVRLEVGPEERRCT